MIACSAVNCGRWGISKPAVRRTSEATSSSAITAARRSKQRARLAVLHTWTRGALWGARWALLDHPHVHLLVTVGGLSAHGAQWIAPKKANFLAPEGALAVIVRAQMCVALNQAGLLPQVPPQVWEKDWVVHCKAAGSGRKALEYLGRYVFRVAITNRQFIGRFLQHVLPPGCTKLRCYGLWSNSCGRQLEQARALLDAPPRAASDSLAWRAEPAVWVPTPARCPYCRLGQLIVIQVLRAESKLPP